MSRHCWRWRRRAAGTISMTAVLVTVACSERAPTSAIDSGNTSVTTPLIVSAPSAASVVPSSLRARYAPARAVAVAGTFVYVSLPPGTVPSGARATIRDNVNAQVDTTSVVNGGFDPVAIPGSTGDQLTIDIVGAAGLLWTNSVKVPPRRPPMIVRTSPPNGKTDVPLNTRVAVVFSEPVDPATVGGSLQLLTGGAAVAGKVTLLAPGLMAEIEPDSPLAPNAEYDLVITTGVRNLDGDALQANVRVPFTTGTSSAANTGIIAFQSSRGIEAINPDGTGRTVLIADATAFEPAWSPDGTRIAFTRTPDGWNSCDIYIARADGSGVERLTTPLRQPWCANTPAWSPDGTKIAFAAGPAGCAYSPQCNGQDIYLVDADGANEKRLFSFANILIRPTWSPDGANIAFECSYFATGPGPDGLVGICAGDTAGSSVRRLVACCPEAPVWSPDGYEIAFQEGDHPGGAIGLMNSDGTNVRNLVATTSSDSSYGEPAWSPDGTRLVFTLGSFSGGVDVSTDLYVMNRNGTGLQRLTVTGDVHHPSWSSLTPRSSSNRSVRALER